MESEGGSDTSKAEARLFLLLAGYFEWVPLESVLNLGGQQWPEGSHAGV